MIWVVGAGLLAIFAGRSLSRRGREKDDIALSTEELHKAPPAVFLEWGDVRVKVKDKRHPAGRLILSHARGVARPGRILAIMGASGSGKSTLLRVLAGRLPNSGAYSVQGYLRIRIRRASQARELVGNTSNTGNSGSTQAPFRTAFIEQEESFFSQLTARETLEFYAELLLPRRLSKSARQAFVENLISELGLGRCAETRIGDARNPGLSGGERKRLAIGCELFGSPSLIFADEPTTGLDASQALKVMEVFRRLADESRTVIVTLHQPRSSILDLIDDLIILCDGEIVYAGEYRLAAEHFEQVLGLQRPAESSVAEWLIDEVSPDQLQPEHSRRKVSKLIAAVPIHLSIPSNELEGTKAVSERALKVRLRPVVPLRTQARLLLQRAWRQVSRDWKTNLARLGSTIFSALLFGSIYYRLGLSQAAAQDRLGLLQVSTINTAMSALVKTLYIFTEERSIASKERARGMYDLSVYIATKLLAEAPIAAAFPVLFGILTHRLCGLRATQGRLGRFLGMLTLESFASAAFGLCVGAIAPTTQAAVAIGPALMVIFIVFGGFFVTNPPSWARSIPEISLIRWAFQGLAVNELRGLRLQKSNTVGEADTGDAILARMQMNNVSLSKAFRRESQILLGLYALTLSMLMLREKFAPESKQLLRIQISSPVDQFIFESGPSDTRN
jgi:ABC-type multidrug transport system ATPase subunit